jgi:ABC-type spermidine/putrescine transport system permease subunit I
MVRRKSYFDKEFLKNFINSFLSLLFALAALLIGTSITDLMTPETPLIPLEIANQNISKFIELSDKAERATTISKATNSIYIAIGIILIAFLITIILAWYSQKRKNNP